MARWERRSMALTVQSMARAAVEDCQLYLQEREQFGRHRLRLAACSANDVHVVLDDDATAVQVQAALDAWAGGSES